jgi:hypothetical protein
LSSLNVCSPAASRALNPNSAPKLEPKP